MVQIYNSYKQTLLTFLKSQTNLFLTTSSYFWWIDNKKSLRFLNNVKHLKNNPQRRKQIIFKSIKNDLYDMNYLNFKLIVLVFSSYEL